MRSFSYPRVRKLVASDSGLISGLLWGFAEALFWPIIPDYYVLAVVPTLAARWWRVALFTSAGSVIGGSAGFWWSYARGDTFPLALAPLVTPGMLDAASAWLAELGAMGVLRQPLSGVPYKVFVYLAGAERLPFFLFFWTSVVARSFRIFAVAAIGAGLGKIAGDRRLSRFYDVFLILYTTVFVYGLWRVAGSVS